MKNHIILFAAVAVMLSLSACSLEEYNPGSATADNEWTSLAGYGKKINDCYFDFIRIVYGQAEDTFVPLSECATDLWGTITDRTDGWGQVATLVNYGGNTGMMGEPYNGFYSTLSACNGAIAYAKKVTGASEAEISALEAEAHYLRAHALFNIVEYFGGKYLTTEEISAVGPLKALPMSTVNEFYEDVIFPDLEFAIKYLPVEQQVTGHVIRAAAYHLYAKACATYASYTDGLGNCTALTDAQAKEWLQKGKQAADYLIQNASSLGVGLYANASEVFADANNKKNKEALFVVTHSSITALNPRGNYFNRIWKHMCTWNNNSSSSNVGPGLYMECLTQSYDTNVNGVSVEPRAKGNAYYAPTKYLIDLYNEDMNDTRFDAFFRTVWTANKANNGNDYTWTANDATRWGLDASRVGNAAYNIHLGDTCIALQRVNMSQAERDAVRYATYNIYDNYGADGYIGRVAPSLQKADLTSMYGGSNPGKAFTWADCIIYRLAETYLISAEIDWKLGDNAGAADRLNTIRNRAQKNHDHSMDVTASQVSKQLLLDENARELCGEWNRWTTLKRFRAFETQLVHNPQVKGFNKDIHYLRAIPIAEINLIENQSEYQNPGY